jgi:hypothetical protein
MKKILTLTTAFIMAFVTLAMARQPQVTVSVNNMYGREYDISIDGRLYTANNVTLTNLYPGMHSIEVYEVRNGGILGIGKKRVLVSSSSFRLNNADVQINVDRNGQLRINEYGYNNGGWNNNGNYGNRDCDDKRYDHSNGNWNNGRGNKYGHYKKNKNGKGKWDDDDDRYRRDNDYRK